MQVAAADLGASHRVGRPTRWPRVHWHRMKLVSIVGSNRRCMQKSLIKSRDREWRILLACSFDFSGRPKEQQTVGQSAGLTVSLDEN